MGPEANDAHLLQAFVAGDPDAVRVLYRRYAGPVATIARSVVGPDQPMIDDIVQLTFTKAWKAAGTLDPTRAFSPWLYSIARRCAIDAIRAEQRPTRGGHEPEVDVAEEAPSLVRVWEAYEVRQAVDGLPEEERAVLFLAYQVGLSQPQIAERLGVPVGTVKSRSHRAHQRLARALAHVARSDAGPSGAPDPAGPPNAVPVSDPTTSVPQPVRRHP
jgi:RNA polymerase sigma-70 factor (ECF subfamily)